MPLASMLAPLLVALAASNPAPSPPAPPPAPFSADECAVFARELSFARAVANHDAAAFAAHIAADAAFAAGAPRPQRGRAAIVEAWAGIVRGDAGKLEWYPQRTTVVGDLAWSTGPALMERMDADRARFTRSTFQSVWRRGGDGTWLVVFDGGTPPVEVDAGAAAAFRAARPEACPGS